MTDSMMNSVFHSIGRTPTQSFGAPFPEWSDPLPQSPLRQGDVITAVSSDVNFWRDLLIVITADCDLARDKHGGSLTCVPIIRLERYLLLFRYEKLRDSLVARMLDSVIVSLATNQAGIPAPTITPDRLRQWLAEEDIDTVVAALASFQLSDRSVKLLRQLQSACKCQPETINSAIETLGACKVALEDAKNLEKGRAVIAADFASSLKSLPGDVLLLNSVSSRHGDGFVAYLRRIVEVAELSVAKSYSRLPNDAQYVRISRIRAPYVYALTQQFAAVFSAIGLPTEYEEARESISNRIRNGTFQ